MKKLAWVMLLMCGWANSADRTTSNKYICSVSQIKELTKIGTLDSPYSSEGKQYLDAGPIKITINKHNGEITGTGQGTSGWNITVLSDGSKITHAHGTTQFDWKALVTSQTYPDTKHNVLYSKYVFVSENIDEVKKPFFIVDGTLFFSGLCEVENSRGSTSK